MDNIMAAEWVGKKVEYSAASTDGRMVAWWVDRMDVKVADSKAVSWADSTGKWSVVE